LIIEGEQYESRRKTYIYVNNRLEGNALETISASAAAQSIAANAVRNKIRIRLDDFVNCYFGKTKATPHLDPLTGRGGEGGASRFNRKETERFKRFTYDELLKRDKVNLDIFWLKDESLEESANLPAPDVIATDITEDLETALDNFAMITGDMKK